MPSKTISVLNGDGSTRTITIPDRSRFAGVRNISRAVNELPLTDATTSIQVTVAGHSDLDGIYTGSVPTGATSPSAWIHQGGRGIFRHSGYNSESNSQTWFVMDDVDYDPDGGGDDVEFSWSGNGASPAPWTHLPSSHAVTITGVAGTETLTVNRTADSGGGTMTAITPLSDGTTSIQVTVAGHSDISGIYTRNGFDWVQQGGSGRIVREQNSQYNYHWLVYDNSDGNPYSTFGSGLVSETDSRPWKPANTGIVTIAPVPETLTVNRFSDRKGESRPLLSKLVGGAAAAYSLRDLNDRAGNNKVVEVRRFTDSQDRQVLAKEVANGTLEAFANESVKYLDSTGTTTQNVTTNGIVFPVVGGADYLANNLSFSATGGFNNTEKYSFTGSGDNGSFSHNWYLNNAFNVTRIGSSAPNKTVTVEAYVKRTSGSSSDNLYFRPYATNTSNKITVTGLVQDEWTFVKGTLIKDSAVATKNQIQIGGDTGVTFEVSNIKFYSENNDVMVSKWYDQSGNDNHAVQPTAEHQPPVVKAGIVVDKGIDFDGVSLHHLQPSLLLPTIQNSTVISVSTKRNNSTGYVAQINRGLDRMYLRHNVITIGDPASNTSGSTTNGVTAIHTITATSGGLFTIFQNGTSIGTTNYTTDVGGGDSHIGSGNNGSAEFDGVVSELIVYHTDQSANRLAIEANIKNQYDIS